MPKGTILVVDDELDSANHISLALREQDYEVFTCQSGLEALRLIRETPFDLAIIDITMPVMSGTELLSQIRSMGLNFPAILLRGSGKTQDIVEGIEDLDVSKILTKPTSYQELLEAVAEAISRAKKEVRLRKEKGYLKKKIIALSDRIKKDDSVHRDVISQYSELLDQLGQPVIVICKGKIVFANNVTFKWLEYSPDELIKRDILSLVKPKDHSKVRQLIMRILSEDRPHFITVEVIKKDGTIANVEATVTLTTWEKDPAFLAILKDITIEVKQNRLTEQILKSCPWGIYILKENKFFWANDAFLSYVGYSWDEMVHISPSDLVYEEDRKEVREKAISHLKGELFEPYQYRYVDKKGDIKWALERRIAITDLEMRRLSLAYVLDITSLKKAEENFRSISVELINILDSISSILITLSSDGKAMRINKAASKLFNLPEEGWFGLSIEDIFKNTEVKKIKNGILECISSKKPVSLEDLRYLRGDGKVGYLSMDIFPSFNERHEVSYVIVTGSDITSQKILMSHVLQSQKLEAIGQLAAGIAHEINTPVQYIGDNLRFIRSAMENILSIIKAYQEVLWAEDLDPKVQEEMKRKESDLDISYLLDELPMAVAQSLEGVERISKIVLSIKNFAHPGVQEKVQFDLNNAIESTVNVCRNTWKYVADMELKLDPNLPPIYGYPGELNQVILNLILNAVHAIEEKVVSRGEKGKITVETKLEPGFVLISVTDTGTGIPVEIRDKIFDPFFTTKAPGKGTGQGLAIAYRYVVDLHKGQIFFTSEVGIGTTFYVRLPIS